MLRGALQPTAHSSLTVWSLPSLSTTTHTQLRKEHGNELVRVSHASTLQLVQPSHPSPL